MDGMLGSAVRDGNGRDGGSGGGPRRRIWPAAIRAAIVAESFGAGAKVSEVAARHGVNAGMLSTWRRQAFDQASAGAPASSSAVPAFVAVKLSAGSASKTGASPQARLRAGVIEIVLGDANIHAPRGVDAVLLSRVLAAVRGQF